MAEGDGDEIVVSSTELMSALEQEAFEEAERLIMENNDPEYLNKGSFESYPLYIVLSGNHGYRHLYLAKLLVKRGANVNPPPQHSGIGTPLEELLHWYLEIRDQCNENFSSHSNSVSTIMTIGLQQEVNPPPSVLKDQLWQLTELLLAYGADPNIVMDYRSPSIFHAVVANKIPDTDLVMKLFEAGGDFNKLDIHGNTPLMDLVISADQDSAWPLFNQILSLTDDLDFTHQNCTKETILWRAMFACSPRIATCLLHRGIDPTPQSDVFIGESEPTSVSAIFAPLVGNSSVYRQVVLNKNFDISLMNKVMASTIFPVVDSTNICNFAISELTSFLNSKTSLPMNELVSRELCPEDVIVLMFGHLTAGLQQLCIRKIMEELITKKCLIDTNLNSIVQLKSSEVTAIVKKLLLPTSIVPRFLIEAARLQVSAVLYSTESRDCYEHVEDHSDTNFQSNQWMDDDNVEEEDYTDSDHEFEWG